MLLLIRLIGHEQTSSLHVSKAEKYSQHAVCKTITTLHSWILQPDIQMLSAQNTFQHGAAQHLVIARKADITWPQRLRYTKKYRSI